MRQTSAITIAIILVTALGRTAVGQDAQGPLPFQVGVTEEASVRSPRPYGRVGAVAATVWSHTFEKAGATFVRVHFTADSSLDEDGDDVLIVRDGEGEVVGEYRGGEMADLWTGSAIGESLSLELVASSGGPGVLVDQVAWGTVPIVEQPPPATAGFSFYSICNTNVPERVRIADPVAYFTFVDDCGGVFQCTGFLFSPMSHFLTNAHCANTPTEAASVDVLFNYQGSQGSSCRLLGRPYREAFQGAQFYAMGCSFDYSVLILNRRSGNILASDVYGYLQLSNDQPAVGEELWIPQHPSGRPKEIAEDCEVLAFGVPGFNACADPPNNCNTDPFPVANAADVAFDCRIEHGSSGSPVLNLDNKVVALAHAGSVTQNYGVRMDRVLLDIPNRPLTLTLTGPDTVNEGTVANFMVTATFLTTPVRSVTTRAVWSVTPPTIGSIVSGTSEGGRFTANLVEFNRTVTIGASYTSNGVTVTATKQITLLDVPSLIAIVGSDPPENAIDAGRPMNPATLIPQGWQLLTATFDGDVSLLSSGHFSVSELGAKEAPPSVADLVPVGFDTVQLRLSGPIQPGAWTMVEHTDSGTTVRLGFLPGDVNGDASVGPLDLQSLIEEFFGEEPTLPMWSTDLDRSGAADLLDLMTGVELLLGSGPFEAWNGTFLP